MLTVTLICLLFVLGFGRWYYSYKIKICLVTAIVWGLYPVYEFWIQSTCSGDCSIRVDLLLIVPIIITLSIKSILSITKLKNKKL
jgi:hypothetical protein